MKFSKPVVLSVMVAINGVLTPFLAAEEVQWRTDYAAAVKEAAEKNLPLFLDVYTTWCRQCTNLDTITFRDPAVIKILNEKFIAVKVDADKSVVEVQGQKVQAFPTMFFLTADGNLLAKQEGFAEAGLWQQLADKALGSPAAAKKEAVPFQAEAKIGARGQRGNVWKGPRNSWATPRFSADPISSREERTLRAREILVQAVDSYRKQQWLGCLEQTRVLIVYYPDLPESVDARQLAQSIGADSLEKLGKDLTENLSQVYWELAQQKLRQGQTSQAVLYLERIVQACPGTRYAAPAQELLHRHSDAAPPSKASIKISTR